MKTKLKNIRVGVLIGMLDLYNRLCPNLREDMVRFFNQQVRDFGVDELEFILSSPVSTKEQVETESRKFLDREVDLIVVALAPYCPSGILAPSLLKTKTPLLLWPAQSMFRLEPEDFDFDTIVLNHGVHAIQDLANVLRKNGRSFGIIHGHLKQDDFKEEFTDWARAAKALCIMQKANPIQIGGHFEDMLDLQIGSDDFVRKMDLEHKEITIEGFYAALEGVNDGQVEERIKYYRSIFKIADSVSDDILDKTARGEIALRAIMEKYNSQALGINFMSLCNDKRIGDPLHVAGSILMNEGLGYAAEGDWVTASFVYAMQQAFSVASFSEIFSVGYEDNRLVLLHWGEGNFAMARTKPKLKLSTFTDEQQIDFAIVDFEFEPGPVTLINLNSTPQEQGQVITITGSITEDDLTKAQGPKAIFKPDRKDVRELLTNYAYNGGSHHLAVVKSEVTNVIEKMCRFAGWKHIIL